MMQMMTLLLLLPSNVLSTHPLKDAAVASHVGQQVDSREVQAPHNVGRVAPPVGHVDRDPQPARVAQHGQEDRVQHRAGPALAATGVDEEDDVRGRGAAPPAVGLQLGHERGRGLGAAALKPWCMRGGGGGGGTNMWSLEGCRERVQIETR